MTSCELCSNAAIVAAAICEADGSSTTKFYCESHAKALNLVSEEQFLNANRDILNKLRALKSFTKRHSRMPNDEECIEIGFPPQFAVGVSQSGSSIERQMAFIECLVEFIDNNGRYPNADEMPPNPFDDGLGG
jgi:hypothetical protein